MINHQDAENAMDYKIRRYCSGISFCHPLVDKSTSYHLRSRPMAAKTSFSPL